MDDPDFITYRISSALKRAKRRGWEVDHIELAKDDDKILSSETTAVTLDGGRLFSIPVKVGKKTRVHLKAAVDGLSDY